MFTVKNSNTFEKLDIWTLAQELAKDLSEIFYVKTFRNYSFQDQIMRAVISISNNIAEGYGRGGDKEFIYFLYVSKGSCEEVKSMLYLAYSFDYIKIEKRNELLQKCVSLSVKIHNFVNYLSKKKQKISIQLNLAPYRSI